jgi:hypothetical protein
VTANLTVFDWIIAVAPLAVLGGMIWFLIVQVMKFWAGYTEMQKRQTMALERIATALEKRQ